MSTLPRRVRTYRHPLLDSRRWDALQVRPGDIIVTTSMKAGTTWMQTIVAHLIHGEELPGAPVDLGPWLGNPIFELEGTLATLEAQDHRRFLKSHLPLDALPYFPEAQYIVVCRDTRDVFMSVHNHHSGYTDAMLDLIHGKGVEIGVPFPPAPQDIRQFWRTWISQSHFPWESDGFPYWSHHHHLKSYWPHRHLDNVLMVHFNDLLTDLDGQMRRIADYLGLSISPERWPRLVEAATFDSMKKRADALVPRAQFVWKGGAQQFINKGTNGRWRDVLTEEDLTLYAAAKQRSLSEDCAHWLEEGGQV